MMSEVFIPNEHQLKVFDFIKNEIGHCVVEAVAGSGKTLTILKALNIIDSKKKCAFVAFNAHIAEELKSKAPRHVDVRTLHSLGLKAVTDTFGDVMVDGSKVYKILRSETEGFDDWKIRSSVVSHANKIIGLLKANLLEPSSDNIDDIIMYHNMERPNYSYMNDLIRKVFVISVNQTSVVDFDDMIFLPGWLDLTCKKYDYVMVDEAQDLNKAQLHLVLASIKKGSRIIAVGDRNQSIYGFRGADVDSIPKIIEKLGATVLPLDITYRCPKSHVAYAQKFVPEIHAAPDAKEGKVISETYSDFYEAVQENDLVLCRNNSPLLSPCMNLIQQGRKASIRGREIGKDLISLIKSLKAKNLDALYSAVEMWEADQFVKYRQKNQNPQAIEDKAQCLLILINGAGVDNVSELIKYIETLFSDDKAEVVFSSIHKAKGLEADNVFILEPNLMPSQYAKQGWEMQQEANVEYVAITRAKENLHFVYK